MPFLSHGGISLRYERAGTGLPLVFIHGLMGNHTFWDRQSALRERFLVVRLDLRGHGDSSKPKGSYAIATLAEDVRHLVIALGLQRAVLVGSSMGGVVAQHALRVLGERVVGLALVGTTASALAAEGYEHGIKQEEQVALVTSAQNDYKSFVRDLGSRLFMEGHSELLQWAIQQMTKTPPYVAVAALQGLFAADERNGLASIEVPTLVCHGRHDVIFPLATAEYLHQHIKGSRLVAFENSAHLPMSEEDDRFNSELAAFAGALA
jgi:pimeloyl-ACP methyl ester carboxylesterase